MDTMQIKSELHQFVDIGDEQILRMLYAMITEYNKFGNLPTRPYSKTEFVEDIKEAEQQIKQGDFLTIEDFEKEAQEWK